MRIRKVRKHTDPTDLDPDADTEHWYIYIILQRYKSHKEVTKSRNQGFSYYFFLMMNGSISGSAKIGAQYLSEGWWMKPGQASSYLVVETVDRLQLQIAAALILSVDHQWAKFGACQGSRLYPAL